MAKIRIPGLISRTNKSGVTTWYWQPSKTLKDAGWVSKPLGTSADEAIDLARARNREVDEWRRGGSRPAAVRKIVRLATVSALIQQYKNEGWPSVKKPGTFIAPGTRETYAAMFKTIEAWAGDVPISAIDADRVAVFREALMKPAARGRYKGQVRHTAAHSTLRVLRTLFTYAEQKRLIPKGANPAAEFHLAMPDPRDHIWWAPAREALLETATDDLMMATAIAVAFQTGQREADILKLTHTQYVPIPPYKIEDLETYELLAATPVPAFAGRKAYIPGDVMGLTLRQGKGKRWVEVPIVGIYRAMIEAAIAASKAAHCTTILVDERPPQGDEAALERQGWRPRPWTAPNLKAGQARFIRRFAEIRAATVDRLVRLYGEHDDEKALGLAIDMDELQYRDFRRTAVVYLGELGIPDHLIAAITGHSLDETKKILDTYMPRTTGMAAKAIALSHARAPKAREKKG